MNAWCLLLGAALGAPLWIVLTVWAMRRLWRNARRLAARTKGRGHLIELAHLAGGLAHEIKNPLSTINVNLKLFSEDLERTDEDSRRRSLRRLNIVRGEADRLRGIVDDFLRFAGKVEPQVAVVDLRRLVEELLDFFTPQAEASGVLIRSAMPDQPVSCLVDANLIKEVVLNLMINAVDAMSDGGELHVRLSTNRRRAALEVIDTGPGMDGETCEKIFDVFYSTKKHGTGLGLPTTRRIIREHDGTIRVESEPGKGTRFIISLPLVGK